MSKLSCESWTMNSTLMKRIDASEQWCYRRMLKIIWTDKVTNDAVLAKICLLYTSDAADE